MTQSRERVDTEMYEAAASIPRHTILQQTLFKVEREHENIIRNIVY